MNTISTYQNVVKQKRAVQTQEKLLKAAGIVFAQKGFDSCSIREIGKVAGLNHQKIIYHFNTKEELFFKVIENGFKIITEAGEDLKKTVGDNNPIARYAVVLKRVAKAYLKNPEFIKIMYQETLSNSPRLEHIRPLITAHKNQVEKNLSFLQDYGFGDNLPLEDLLIIFSGSFHASIVHPFRDHTNNQSEEDFQKIERHIDSLFKAFAPKD